MHFLVKLCSFLSLSPSAFIHTHFKGKLRDATGSYNLPFLITGALLWGPAAILTVVVKCSCWREGKLLDDESERQPAATEQACEHVNLTGACEPWSEIRECERSRAILASSSEEDDLV